MKNGFTVGEILITLAIIGVIATLTIPPLVQDIQKKIYATRVKATYSQIMAAIDEACAENNASSFAEIRDDNGISSFHDALNPSYYFGNCDSLLKISNYSTIGTAAGEAEPFWQENVCPWVLRNGVRFIMEEDKDNKVLNFVFDINGKKEPNVVGRDFFTFKVDSTTNTLIPEDPGTCTTSKIGVGCLQKLMNNNWVMNY